jgi:hypothetical protein
MRLPGPNTSGLDSKGGGAFLCAPRPLAINRFGRRTRWVVICAPRATRTHGSSSMQLGDDAPRTAHEVHHQGRTMREVLAVGTPQSHADGQTARRGSSSTRVALARPDTGFLAPDPPYDRTAEHLVRQPQAYPAPANGVKRRCDSRPPCGEHPEYGRGRLARGHEGFGLRRPEVRSPFR